MTIKFKQLGIAMAMLSGLAASGVALAAVSADEAAKLKTALTPLGGEKAGNKDGSIPAWDGGLTKGGGAMHGDVPSDLFAGDKPVLQITAKNMAQHADKLSEGTQALMQKYPDSFRVDVYPTRRSAAAPQSVYDNTFKNATRCKLKDGGNSVESCYGGIPFPIPKEGVEVVWNYLLRVEAEAIEYGFKNIVGSADGSRTLATRNDNYWNHPYYYKDGSPEKWSGKYFLQRFNTTAPSFKVGESLVIHDSIDPAQPRQAWQYLVGQRRVRRAPTVAYDTPDFVASGANYFDEVQGYFGHPDRYQWKLVGKKEMYIPYNDNGFVTAKVDEHRHRLHDGRRNLRHHERGNLRGAPQLALGVETIDQGNNPCVLVEVIAALGHGVTLARSEVRFDNPYTVQFPPQLVRVEMVLAEGVNLQANTLSTVQFLNEETYRVVPRKDENFYTGEAVAAEGAR